MYLLRINLMERDSKNKIKTWKPIVLSEKTSKKNPPIRAEIKPKFSSDFSNKFKKNIKIKIKFKAEK